MNAWLPRPVFVIGLLAVAAVGSSRESRLPISEETTIVTQPISSDGWPDYVAALVASRKKYAASDNAAVLYWRAIGSRDIDEVDRAGFFRELGCKLPAENNVLVPLDSEDNAGELLRCFGAGEDAKGNMVAARRALALAQHMVANRAIAEKVLWKWSKHNERPVELLVKASGRRGFYSPPTNAFAMPRPTLLELLLPDAANFRQAIGSLTGRSMLRLSAGRIDSAWGDLEAAFRLTELYDRGDLLVGCIVADESRGGALKATQSYLSRIDQSYQARRVTKFLSGLSEESRIEGPLLFCEQLTQIDILTRVFVPDRFGNGERPEGWIKIASLADPEAAFSVRTELAKQVKSVLQRPDRPSRRRAARAFDERFTATLEEKTKSAKQMPADALQLRKKLGRYLGYSVAAYLLPNIESVVVAEDRAICNQRLTLVAAQLTESRINHGHYPEELLSLWAVPPPAHHIDPFTNQPFRYESRGDGFLLYSLGPNGVDDNASDSTGEFVEGEYAPVDWFGEREEPDGPDDIVVRLPVPELEVPHFGEE